jgi:hypothetical protein
MVNEAAQRSNACRRVVAVVVLPCDGKNAMQRNSAFLWRPADASEQARTPKTVANYARQSGFERRGLLSLDVIGCKPENRHEYGMTANE